MIPTTKWHMWRESVPIVAVLPSFWHHMLIFRRMRWCHGSTMITIYTQGQSGASSRRLQLTPHSGPRPVFVLSFRAAIYPYIAHAHGAKWQDRQFRACLASFQIGVVVSVVDFAENYTFAPQIEIQSEYYFSEQV